DDLRPVHLTKPVEKGESHGGIDSAIACIQPINRPDTGSQPRPYPNQDYCRKSEPNGFPQKIEKHDTGTAMGQPKRAAKQIIQHHISRAGANMICSAVWIAFEAAIRRLSDTNHRA